MDRGDATDEAARIERQPAVGRRGGLEGRSAGARGVALSRRELLRRALAGGIPAASALLFAQACQGPATATTAPAAATTGAAAATTALPAATATVASTPGLAGTATRAANATTPSTSTAAAGGGVGGGAATPPATATRAPSPTGVATRAASPALSPTAAISTPPAVRAIYLTPQSMIDDAEFNPLLALADRTEINAMVIDFKDEAGQMYHDSQVVLARELGAIRPRYDLPARLKTLKERNIYTIARIVCMQDPTLAAKRPALAVRNSKTGGIWENDNGVGWVNALRPEVWRYNLDIALEAARLGFDEIQYDYVRFPSDGDMEAIDIGPPSTVAVRSEAIYQFLKLSREALAPLGWPLAADIFGIVLILEDDNGIGQNLEKLAPVTDYLCPMVYPSHYPRTRWAGGCPTITPTKIILESLQIGGQRIADAERKFRPGCRTSPTAPAGLRRGRGARPDPGDLRLRGRPAGCSGTPPTSSPRRP